MDVFGNVTNNGTVAIQSGRSVYFYGHVNGSGSYTGVGTAILASKSSLNVELGGIDPGTQYDKLLVAGALTLGGSLHVSLINGFTPAANQSFDILDWGTLTGTFDSIQLPALTGGLEWNTSQLYMTGVLSVASPGLPGDYNQNGTVDAADYVIWRKTGINGQQGYDDWRANFGVTTGSGSGVSANVAVPEPATFMLLVFATAGWYLRRRWAA